MLERLTQGLLKFKRQGDAVRHKETPTETAAFSLRTILLYSIVTSTSRIFVLYFLHQLKNLIRDYVAEIPRRDRHCGDASLGDFCQFRGCRCLHSA